MGPESDLSVQSVRPETITQPGHPKLLDAVRNWLTKKPSLNEGENIIEDIFDERERPLLGRIKRIGRLGGGINKTFRVIFEDGKIGVFKPATGERKSKSKLVQERRPVGTYFKRERAAYLLDRIIGFDLIPPTIIRSIGRRKVGSLQEFIPDTTNSIDNTPQSELYKLWILDYILFHPDRMYNTLAKGNKVFAIDNGFAFSNTGVSFQSRTEFYKAPPSPELVEMLDIFVKDAKSRQMLRDKLSPLLSASELAACEARIVHVNKLLIQKGQIDNGSELPYHPI